MGNTYERCQSGFLQHLSLTTPNCLQFQVVLWRSSPARMTAQTHSAVDKGDLFHRNAGPQHHHNTFSNFPNAGHSSRFHTFPLLPYLQDVSASSNLFRMVSLVGLVGGWSPNQSPSCRWRKPINAKDSRSASAGCFWKTFPTGIGSGGSIFRTSQQRWIRVSESHKGSRFDLFVGSLIWLVCWVCCLFIGSSWINQIQEVSRGVQITSTSPAIWIWLIDPCCMVGTLNTLPPRVASRSIATKKNIKIQDFSPKLKF